MDVIELMEIFFSCFESNYDVVTHHPDWPKLVLEWWEKLSPKTIIGSIKRTYLCSYNNRGEVAGVGWRG